MYLTFAVSPVAGKTDFAWAVVEAGAQVATRGRCVARRHAAACAGIHRLAGAAGQVQLVVWGAGTLVAAGRVGAHGVRRGAEMRGRVCAFVHVCAVRPVALQLVKFSYSYC
jgi:hypothetical protein